MSKYAYPGSNLTAITDWHLRSAVDDGVMPNTKTNQKSFTIASEYKLTDKIKITTDASYIRTYSPNKANVVGSNSVLNSLLFNFPTI